MQKPYLTPLEGLPHRRKDDAKRSRHPDNRKPDWRFSVLADFEELIRSYGQDHMSLGCQ